MGGAASGCDAGQHDGQRAATQAVPKEHRQLGVSKRHDVAAAHSNGRAQACKAKRMRVNGCPFRVTDTH